jgi:hypothetical protein
MSGFGQYMFGQYKFGKCKFGKWAASLLGACLLATVTTSSHAQSNLRIRGTITGLEGNVLSVKSRDGKDLQVHLADNLTVSAAKALSLADIKPGDFVGPASRKRPDGKLEAISVQVFPPALRGVVPEGHIPWDLEPGSLMTNATVASLVQGVDGKAGGRELVLEYKGGSQTVLVPEGVPIFTGVPGERSLLVPGATVFIGARVAEDGKITASRVNVSKDGAKPAN